MRVELAWCDALLSRWGRWSIRCGSGALGYASMSIIASDIDGDSYDMAVPLGVQDEDMEAVNKAVGTLPHVIRIVVIEVYQLHPGKSDRKHADYLGISRQALEQYLSKAHRKIAFDISKTSHYPTHYANGQTAP